MLHTRSSRLAVAALLAASVGLGPGWSAARAAPPREVRKLHRAARTDFRRGDYQDAVAKLREARQLGADPKVDLLLGRALTELGECDEAIGLLEGLTDLRRLRKAERDAAELTCRTKRIRAAAQAFRCHDIEPDAKAVAAMEDASVDAREEAAAMLVLGKRCLASFDTRTDAGREAAVAHGRALARLAEGKPDDAVTAARDSLRAFPTPAAHLVAGLALAAADRCSDAMSHLDRAHTAAADRDDGPRWKEAYARCGRLAAQESLDKDDCAAALPQLVLLEGHLSGDGEQWRQKAYGSCESKGAPFPIETAQDRTAWRMLVHARAALAHGDDDKALGFLEQAARLRPHPSIELERGRVLVEQGRCAEAGTAFGNVPAAALDPTDGAILRTCGPYSPQGKLNGAELRLYARHVTAALMGRRAGEPAVALERVADAIAVDANPRLAALQADLHYESGDCDAWKTAVEQLGPLRALVTDADTRCAPDDPVWQGGKPAAASSPAAADPSAAGPGPAASTRDSDQALWGWILVGTGVALGAGAGVFAWRYVEDTGPLADASNKYTAMRFRGASARALDAQLEEVFEAENQVISDAIFTWSLAGLGAASLGVGAWLLIDDALAGSSAAAVRPLVTPSSVGIAGSF